MQALSDDLLSEGGPEDKLCPPSLSKSSFARIPIATPTTRPSGHNKWLFRPCWTQAQQGPGSNRSCATLSGNSLRQTVHAHCAVARSQSSKIGSSPVKGCEGNCRPGGKRCRLNVQSPGITHVKAYRQVYDSRHLQADCQKQGSAPEPYAR